MIVPSQQFTLTNRLLAAIPRTEFERLTPHLEQINLPTNTLYDMYCFLLPPGQEWQLLRGAFRRGAGPS